MPRGALNAPAFTFGLACAALLVASSPAAAETKTTRSPAVSAPTCALTSGVHDVRVGPKTRRVHLALPASQAAGVAMSVPPPPVLFSWHGWGGSAHRTLALGRALVPGAIVVAPEGLPRRFDGLGTRPRNGFQIRSDELDNRDVLLFDAVLKWLDAAGCGETRQVLTTGFSNGGFTSLFLSCVRADRILAAASVGGGGPVAGESCGRAVPTLLVHGKRDRIVPFDVFERTKTRAEKRNACTGASPQQTCRVDLRTWTHSGGHTYPQDARHRVRTFLVGALSAGDASSAPPVR